MNAILFVLFSLLVGDEKIVGDNPAQPVVVGKKDVSPPVLASAPVAVPDLSGCDWTQATLPVGEDWSKTYTVPYPIWGIKYKIELDPPTECEVRFQGKSSTLKSGDYLGPVLDSDDSKAHSPMSLSIRGKKDQTATLSRVTPIRWSEDDLKAGKLKKLVKVLPKDNKTLIGPVINSFGTLAIELPSGYEYTLRHSSGKPMAVNSFIGSSWGDAQKGFFFRNDALPLHCSRETLIRGLAKRATIVRVTTIDDGEIIITLKTSKELDRLQGDKLTSASPSKDESK